MKIEKTIFFYTSVILLIIIASIFPEKFSGHSPFDFISDGALSPCSNHFLGTDFLGRDVLSRTIIAGRLSVIIGISARIGSIIIGLLLGIIIGLSNKSIGFLLNGIVEVFLSIPALLLAMGLAVVLGEGYWTIIIAIIVGTWAPVARFISVKVKTYNKSELLLSAHSIGAGNIRIIINYIIPALLPVLLPLITTGIATSIMMESTLSFLGLGGSASINATPSWGLLIQEGSRFIFDAPWIIMPPSIMLMILILLLNKIGDQLALLEK